MPLLAFQLQMSGPTQGIRVLERALVKRVRSAGFDFVPARQDLPQLFQAKSPMRAIEVGALNAQDGFTRAPCSTVSRLWAHLTVFETKLETVAWIDNFARARLASRREDEEQYCACHRNPQYKSKGTARASS